MCLHVQMIAPITSATSKTVEISGAQDVQVYYVEDLLIISTAMCLSIILLISVEKAQ